LSTNLNEILSAFVGGDREAIADLPALIDRPIRRRARALAPDLVDRALVDDVVSRTWELLLTKVTGSYDPDRSAPITYVNTIARTAVRDVRSTSQTVVRAPRDYSAIEPERKLTKRTEPVSDGGISAVDDAIDLELRLEVLSPRAREAARMIAYDGAPFITAAERVGLSRFALKRQLTGWAAAA
jgi:RNA polymerase sigma factor (sigma-70 family)